MDGESIPAGCEHRGTYEVHPADIADNQNQILPYEGTIFTAILPSGIAGGRSAALRIHPKGNPFKGYQGQATLNDLRFINEKTLRSLREGYESRFMIIEEGQTAHHVTERHWFNAIFLRPLYGVAGRGIYVPRGLRRSLVRDNGEQAIVEPHDTLIMLQSVLSTTSADIATHSPAIQNDLCWLKYLAENSRQVLEALEKRLESS